MPVLSTTIASVISATQFTLTDGSTSDGAYDAHAVKLTNQANSAEFVFGVVESYVGSSKTITLYEDPGAGWTVAAADPFDILAALNKRRRIDQLPSLTPTLNSEFVGIESGASGLGLLSDMVDLVPDANATVPGRVSIGTQSFAGAKTFTGLVDGSAQTAAAANNFMTRALGDARWAQLANGYIFMNRVFIDVSDPSWAFPTGARFAMVELLGAGGAGGGIPTGVPSNGAVAGRGGSSGAYCVKLIDVDALTSKVANIVVGQGGTGVAGAAGTDGGNTTWTDDTNGTITAWGGPGGTTDGYSTVMKFGDDNAQSNLPTGDYLNFRGPTGHGAMFMGGGVDGTMVAKGGRGGETIYGGGGRAVAVRSTGASSASGSGSTGFGCGGGGAAGVGAFTSALAGGSGTRGCCLIWIFG